MDTCPPEILDQIFALACTDDGSTGRALSLVSTRVHDISAPYKYFSVHVIGATSARMSQFVEFVETYDPRIQYLTLDCAILDDGPGPVQEVVLINSPCESQRLSKPTRRKPTRSEHESVCTTTKTILRALASRLKGLYLIPAGVPLTLEGFTFPLLHTFYLYDFPSDISIPWTPSHFPSLKRMDVTCSMAGKSIGHGSPFCLLEGLPALRHLGCCSHVYDGLILTFFFASLLEANNPNYAPKNVGWLSKLSGLETFRIGMSPTRFRDIVAHERVGVSKLMKDVLEKIPSFVCVRRDPVMASLIPMEEWRYVVEGGQDFRRAADGDCVSPRL